MTPAPRSSPALVAAVLFASLAGCRSDGAAGAAGATPDPVVTRLMKGGPPALQPYLDAYPLEGGGTRLDLLATTSQHSMHLVQTTKAISAHVHPQRTETVYVLRGTGTCTVGARVHPVKPGAAFKIAPGTPHEVIPDAGSTLIAIVYYEPPLTVDDRVPVR